MLSPKPLERRAIRVTQRPQIRRIDLGVPVELPEVPVDEAAVQMDAALGMPEAMTSAS